MAKGNLTERQRRFAEAYLEHGNYAKAAEEAGYSPAYAQFAARQPAVKAFLEERRKQLPVQTTEVINFLVGVMRGTITVSRLRVDAAYQVGRRAGLWKNHIEYEAKIKEAMTNE